MKFISIVRAALKLAGILKRAGLPDGVVVRDCAKLRQEICRVVPRHGRIGPSAGELH